MKTSRMHVLAIIAPFLVWSIAYNGAIKKLSDTPVLFWLHDIFVWILLPAMSLLVLHRRCHLTASNYGLGPIPSTQIDVQAFAQLAVVTIAFLSLIPIEVIFSYLIPPRQSAFNYSDVIPRGLSGKLVVFYLAGTAAVVEEVFYRGLLKFVIVKNERFIYDHLVYITLSAALFAVSHSAQGPHKVVATFYLGIVASIVYLRLRNLWFNIGGHFVLNLIAI